MTTNTIVAIQTITVTGSPASSVTFGTGGTIPQTYTDLNLVINCQTTDTGPGNDLSISVNGDTSSGYYSSTRMYGDGSSPHTDRTSGQNSWNQNGVNSSGASAFSMAKLDFMSYSNPNVNKIMLMNDRMTGQYVLTLANLWRNNNPITSITLAPKAGGNFVVGSTFTLYGIANANNSAYATGGIITQDSTYYYHAFGSNGTFTPSRALTADILVIAGGGGGGCDNGGGGGAGGLFYNATQSLTNGTAYTCTIGSGGSGGGSSGSDGTNGVNSSFAALTAVGGGGGAALGNSSTNGLSGGSGGGASSIYVHSGGTGGSPTSGQGNSGGNATSNNFGGAGGGGAGAPGSNGGNPGNTGGNGGNGSSSYSSWLAPGGYGYLNASDGLRYIAGGGGGGANSATPGSGGLGGGAAGIQIASQGTPLPATVNTGGGGGGGGGSSAAGPGGNGGSGIIIVRYAK